MDEQIRHHQFYRRAHAARAKGTAFRISGFYSTVGSLAADDCIGDIYNFKDFNGTINSLGCENRNTQRAASVSVLSTNFAQGTIGSINIQDAQNVESGACCAGSSTNPVGISVS